MSGKFNWDRVNKENLARTRGSQRIDDLPVPKSLLMPKCTCKKRSGFTGTHKKNCPLSKRGGNPTPYRSFASPQPRTALRVPVATKPAPEVTLLQFAEALKSVRQRQDVRDFFSRLLKTLSHDETITTQEKREAGQAISAMLKALGEQGTSPAQRLPSGPQGTNALPSTKER